MKYYAYAPDKQALPSQAKLNSLVHFVFAEQWWIKRMHTSPLRVHKYDQADLVFVAAVLDPQMADDGLCVSFFEYFAPKHLPFLHSKPHILALSHGLVYQVNTRTRTLMRSAGMSQLLLLGMALAAFLLQS